VNYTEVQSSWEGGEGGSFCPVERGKENIEGTEQRGGGPESA